MVFPDIQTLIKSLDVAFLDVYFCIPMQGLLERQVTFPPKCYERRLMGNLWTFGHVVSHTLPPDRVLCIYFYLLFLSLARTYSDTSALRCGELFSGRCCQEAVAKHRFHRRVSHSLSLEYR